ncbi:bifunctional Mini-chromosome maintenance protein/Mini-chromosome maintenance [Babesia duncani]|uniref:DNA replication licensing factor MCM6 n=1 Tax=Babesia duncani TaxID=323732 RepID=A0AAD9PIE1_9APIC|nr:bifunctional Mini-chromosome maintenance protein/Mini-chromosome maintenance [Babesia duncani]
MHSHRLSMDEGLETETNPSFRHRNSVLDQQNISINDMYMDDDEDTPQVQDENIGRVFDFFLRTFVANEAMVINIDEEDDEVEEDFTQELDETSRSLYYLNGNLQQPIYYMKKICKLCSKESQNTEVLQVHTDHIANWQPVGNDMPTNLNAQLYRYIVKNFLRVQDTFEDKVQGVVDGICQMLGKATKKFFIQFLHTPRIIQPLREIRCQMLGELVTLRGQVTRISDVRPELVLGAFRCKSCNNVVTNVRQQFKYTLPRKCVGSGCTNTKEWELLLENCYFCDWQKIRIQELVSESEAGSMPRSIDVILRNKLVDRLNAGDRVQVTGSLIVLPDLPTLMKPGEVPKSVNKQSVRRFESSLASQGLTGIKGVGVRDLNHKLSFLACQVRRINQYSHNISDPNTDTDDSVRAEDILALPGLGWLKNIASATNTIETLAHCIAPRVWGHLEIKKGILLMMVGGVHKSSSNTRLRGDVNMCIVGDPSTAKSQFLKFVAQFAPRAVFASGKGSTAAGLTAAVHKDPDNGDYVLEAGALMYADEGICAIDEFDKMNDRDRVAIHEAMEQQTISITKAGIQATLNARASVLAACNPKYGRYDSSKSFAANVNLPAPLLSRFDLLYTMQDEAAEDVDYKIASHITSLHGEGAYKSSEFVCAQADENQESPNSATQEDRTLDIDKQPALSLDELKLYIELAKKIKPLIQDGAKHKLAQYYVNLRNGDAEANRRSLRMTVRQLESLIRLSEAVARLKFSNFVEESHVHEAYCIFKASLLKLSNKNQIVLEDPVDAPVEKEGAEGEPNTVTLRMTATEYESIAAVLLDHVNECEMLQSAIAANELIEWYIADIVNPTSVQDAEMWNLRLQRLVHRLVHVDNKLVATPTQEGMFILRVHPNYYSSTHLYKRENYVQSIQVDQPQDGEDIVL